MMQLIFFAVSLLVILLGHIVFWLILVRLLEIADLQNQIIAGIIIIIFFLSVIISSYLIHKWDNLFTRWYYILAGFWVGLLVNFGLMTVLILFIKLAGLSLGFSSPVFYIKLIFFGGALLLSLWGVYNAWSPQVKEYEIYIKDLPASWDNKTVVQISDVHLGPVYRRHFFSRLIEQINQLNPEAVFITGDLFDGMEGDFSWLNHPFTKLQAPQGIYYSFGNHDQYLGFKRAKQLLEGNPVQILDNKLEEVNGLQIIGINYSFDKYFDLHQAILDKVGYDKAKPSILLFHAPKDIKQAKQAEIDLQLSGHTHRGQVFPFNWLAKLSHHGYGYGLFKDGDFNLIVTSGVGTWGPPMKTIGHSEIVKIVLKTK